MLIMRVLPAQGCTFRKVGCTMYKIAWRCTLWMVVCIQACTSPFGCKDARPGALMAAQVHTSTLSHEGGKFSAGAKAHNSHNLRRYQVRMVELLGLNL